MAKNRTTGMRVAHLATAKRELFNPKKKTNIERTALMIDIVSVGIPQMKKISSTCGKPHGGTCKNRATAALGSTPQRRIRS